jgi:endogenous inhibitor of DNA gyrase (YacG/DUF329 family)
MRCPICKRETVWEGNAFRPFCSERCKLIDLHNWLSERYRIPAPAETAEEATLPRAAEPGSEGDSD